MLGRHRASESERTYGVSQSKMYRVSQCPHPAPRFCHPPALPRHRTVRVPPPLLPSFCHPPPSFAPTGGAVMLAQSLPTPQTFKLWSGDTGRLEGAFWGVGRLWPGNSRRRVYLERDGAHWGTRLQASFRGGHSRSINSRRANATRRVKNFACTHKTHSMIVPCLAQKRASRLTVLRIERA